jgi:methyltransferase (TIGR00027 family)
VFEVDRPGSLAWKRQRLIELGYGVADGLRLVPDDFETDGSWWAKLAAAGFDAARPAVVASLGVSMYLTREANQATLRQLAALAPGSTVVMTFQPPLELMEAADRPGRVFSENGARASGTPFITFFSPAEALGLARQAGFASVRHVAAGELNERYFSGRSDGLRSSSGEEFLVATT